MQIILSYKLERCYFLFRDSFINFISLYSWILPLQKYWISIRPKLLPTMLQSIILLFQTPISLLQKDTKKSSNCTLNLIIFQDITTKKIWNISISKKVLHISLMEIFKFKKEFIKILVHFYSEKVIWKTRKQKTNWNGLITEEKVTL